MIHNRLVTWFSIALACLASASSVGASEWREVTTCRELSGHTFFFFGGLIDEENAGWKADGIKDGRYTLLTDGKQFDIVSRDVRGQQRSARFHDKATVVSNVSERAGEGAAQIWVLTAYKVDAGFSYEQFTFNLDAKGSGSMVLSQQRSAVISKAGALAGKCTKATG